MEQLKGIQTSTPLSKAFFSTQNISALHTKIRYQVWLNTNKQHVIGNQSNEESKSQTTCPTFDVVRFVLRYFGRWHFFPLFCMAISTKIVSSPGLFGYIDNK